VRVDVPSDQASAHLPGSTVDLDVHPSAAMMAARPE